MLYVIVVNVNNSISLILFATPRSVSRSPLHFMFVDVRKCRDCKRHLRAGLFNLNSDRCFACIRKRNVVRKYKSFKSSVNNTFLIRHIPASEDAIDPLLHLQSSTAKYARHCDEEWRSTPGVGGCSHPTSSSSGRLKTSPRRRGFCSVATNRYYCGLMKYQNKFNQPLLNC